MDRVPISADNRCQRDLRNNLRSLCARWLSSDPIQMGDFSLPLRPLLGLLALALALVGINAVLNDEPDLAKRKLVETAPVATSGYPAAICRSRSGSDGPDGYQADAGAGGAPPWLGGGAGGGPGYPAGSPAPFLYGAPPGPNGYHSGYPYGGDRSFGDPSEVRWLGHRGAGPAPAAYPGFRFREEAVPGNRAPADWADPDGYRFRPLNDQQRERMHMAAERPFDHEAGARSLYDELSGSYGGGFDWEPAAARPDYSRTW